MTVTPDYDVWLQPNHPVRRINMTFSPRLLPALTFALALIAPAQAATPSIAPLPSSLPKPTTPIYPLGKIDGAAVYATGVVSITDYTPGYTPDVCRSDKILIRAAKTDWTPSSARPIYLKAAHKLYHQICQGKMQPAWRQHLRGVVIDEASFQRLLIGQTQDEYLEHHPFYIPLPPEKYQAKRYEQINCQNGFWRDAEIRNKKEKERRKQTNRGCAPCSSNTTSAPGRRCMNWIKTHLLTGAR